MISDFKILYQTKVSSQKFKHLPTVVLYLIFMVFNQNILLLNKIFPINIDLIVIYFYNRKFY